MNFEVADFRVWSCYSNDARYFGRYGWLGRVRTPDQALAVDRVELARELRQSRSRQKETQFLPFLLLANAFGQASFVSVDPRRKTFGNLVRRPHPKIE